MRRSGNLYPGQQDAAIAGSKGCDTMPDKSDDTTLSLIPAEFVDDDPASEKPARASKLYYRIGEACSLTGVPAHVLRFWESEFPQIRPRRTKAGQRLYTQADIKQVLKVKNLVHEKKFTIKGARKYLRTGVGSQDDLLKEIAVELESIRDMLS